MIAAHKIMLAREVAETRRLLHKINWKRKKLESMTAVRHKMREIFAAQEKRILDNFTAKLGYIDADVRTFQKKWNLELEESMEDELEDLLAWLIFTLGVEGEEAAFMITELGPFILESLKAGAAAAIEKVNIIGGFQIKHDLAETWLREYMSSLYETFKEIDKTTTQLIRNKLADCMREGKSVQDMMSEIQKVYKMSDYRAEMIARTEVGRAYNMATIESDKEIGVTHMNLVGCEGTCPQCGPVMDENPHYIDDAWAIEATLHPNHHGNWEPVIDEDWEPRIFEGESPEEF